MPNQPEKPRWHLQPSEPEGKTEQEFIDEAIKWVQEKWGPQGARCPYCGTSSWSVGLPVQILAAFPQFQKGSMSPAFTIMCNNCGQTTLVNAIVSQLMAEDE